jgi:hypothetical protein
MMPTTAIPAKIPIINLGSINKNCFGYKIRPES